MNLPENPLFLSFSLLGIIILILIVASVKIVPQGQEWTLERFGRFTGTMKPGLHIISPFIERIGHRLNTKEQVLDIPPQEVISLDNAIVRVDGVVFYQIIEASKAAYKVDHLDFAMTKLAMTNIRTVLGEMELDHMLSNREVINEKLLRVVDEATDPWGVRVLRIEIQDIKPPQILQEAMSQQLKAERSKRAHILQAQGEREAALLKADGVRESTIAEAEGNKRSIMLKAEALKEEAFLKALAQERKAEAEAKSIQAVSKALLEGEQEAAQYFLTKKYIQALEKMTSGQNAKTIFMPFEATKVISSLGSLAEFFKEKSQPKEGPKKPENS